MLKIIIGVSIHFIYLLLFIIIKCEGLLLVSWWWVIVPAAIPAMTLGGLVVLGIISYKRVV